MCSTWNGSATLEFRRCLQRRLSEYELPHGSALLDACSAYYEELLRWNRRVNLTRLVEPERAATELFLDSALGLPFLQPGERVLDVGSGAGFPGLVLAILQPEQRIDLLDSSDKRCRFLEHVVRLLALPEVRVIHGRFDDRFRGGPYELVISRATFSDLGMFAHACNSLTPQGRLLLWRSKGTQNELPGFQAQEHTLELPGVTQQRCLMLYRRTDGETENHG